MLKFDFKNLKNRVLMERNTRSEVFDLREIRHKNVEHPLSQFGGLFTIKKIDLEDASLFAINDKNAIPGYIHADSSAKTLDLTSDSPKLVLIATGSFYHFIMDDVANMIEAIRQYPDHEIIVDISRIDGLMNAPKNPFTFYFEFLELLKFYGFKHKVVKLTDFDIVYMNDFFTIDFNLVSSLRAETIYEFFGPYVKNPDEKAYRSVYVSRRKQDENLVHKTDDPDLEYAYDGLRVDNELAIEKMFLDMGFEIVYPEDFSGFDEQVNFFHSVKTIASLTSSGLTNAVFMQPGGTVLEIVSPIIAKPILPGQRISILQKAIHNFYKDISYLKNHFYIAIQNPNFKSEEVIATVESNEKLKQFLTVTNE